MRRVSTFRLRPVALLAATALLGMGGVASAQVSVEECIAQNGPRYETPDDATTAQYIDTGGLCRDAASGGDVSITPIGGAKRNGGGGGGQSAGGTGGTAPSGASAQPAGTPTTSAGSGTAAAPEVTSKPKPKPKPKPKAPASTESSSTPATTSASVATSSATVQRALAVADASGGASPPEVSAMPAEVVVALLGAVALGGLGLMRRLVGRR